MKKFTIFLSLLFTTLSFIETFAQTEFKITSADTIYNTNLYLKENNKNIEIGFATPDKERIKKHSRNTQGLLIYRSYKLSDSGTPDSSGIAMVSDGSVENIIPVYDYAKEKGFNRTDKYALPHDYKKLRLDGKGMSNHKSPFKIWQKETWYKDGSDFKQSKQELPTLDEEGNTLWWKHKEFHSRSQHDDKILGVFGRQILKDKTKKWNELREFKFILFNEKGEILNEVEQKYDQAYLPDNIGWVHNMEGKVTGYFISLSEAGGMGAYKNTNEIWAPQNKRVVILDLNGKFISSDIYKMPYKVNWMVNQELVVLSVIEKGDGKYQTIFDRPVMLKQKVKEGFVSFEKNGDIISDAMPVDSEGIDFTEIQEKVPSGENTPFKKFEFAIPLDDGGLLLVGSPDGGLVCFMKLGQDGKIVQWDSRHFAQPFLSKTSCALVKEKVSDNKYLITSKVGNNHRSFSQYAIVDSKKGSFDIVRTSEDVKYGNTARFGNKIVFYGISNTNRKVVLARIDEL